MAKAQTAEALPRAASAAPPAPVTPVAIAPVAPQYRIRESLFRPDIQGYINTVWAADIVDGTPFEEILAPDYWSHVAARLKVGDEIRAFAEDGSWLARLLVRDRGYIWAKVAVLERHVFPPLGESGREAAEFAVEYRGRLQKHAVVRVATGALVLSGFASEGDARTAMSEYVKALRR